MAYYICVAIPFWLCWTLSNMSRSNRWKCFLLIFVFKAADASTYEDSTQQRFNISNGQDNESEFQLFEDVKNAIEIFTYQQENNRSRLLLGCSLDIKRTLSECLGKCTDVSCQRQELQNFLSACSSGTKQSCTTTTAPVDTTTTVVPSTAPTTVPSTVPSKPSVNCKKCGLANLANPKRRIKRRIRGNTRGPNRVVGGIRVRPPRKYPWIVGLFNPVVSEDKLYCGGSIINNRWILTAAHCVINSSTCEDYRLSGTRRLPALEVIVGEHNQYKSKDNDPVNTQIYTVKSYVIHPKNGCKNKNDIFIYDFALLELTRKITFNSVIRPVCLPEDDTKTYAGDTGTVSGWGSIFPYDNIAFSNVLRELDIPIDDQSQCKNQGKVPDHKLCAGPTGPHPGKGACFGDSGGPLVVKEVNKYIQVGVVSYGKEGWCSDPIISAVFGRVSKVLPWIKKTTASGKC